MQINSTRTFETRRDTSRSQEVASRSRKNENHSHNSIIFQLDLGLKSPPVTREIRRGWAIEPDDRPYAPHPYRIHNLEHGYRLAPPFSEHEAIRAIEVLGHAVTRPNGVDANNLIEAAWISIEGAA